MADETYFFDTYAFFEILEGNPNYSEYESGKKIITCKFNLMELYYGLLLKSGKDVAEEWYAEFLPLCVEITDELMKSAMRFKAENKKKNLSYVDCVGYALARSRNAIFLTGDKEFEGMNGVEFVK